MKEKTIYLLLGPKGSGKSFIGSLMETEFDIKFLRVEDWAKKIQKGRSVDDSLYLKQVFETIEQGVRDQLQRHPKVVFESTGLTTYFDAMLSSLKADFNLVTFRIDAEDQLCLRRVRERDQSIHIPISEEMVKNINRQVLEKRIVTDYIILNQNKTASALKIELSSMLKQEKL